jgi:hypothetical protein
VDVAQAAPFLRQELNDGTLLSLGIHYLPAIKKKVAIGRGRGRVTLPTCGI